MAKRFRWKWNMGVGMLALMIGLSACGNSESPDETAEIVATSESESLKESGVSTDTGDETTSADSESESDTKSVAESGTERETETKTSGETEKIYPEAMPEDYDLPVAEVPEFVPDVLNLRSRTYEKAPKLNDRNEVATYILWNFLNNNFEFECYLSKEMLPPDANGYATLSYACDAAMSYYLFGDYMEWDMNTEDLGDVEGYVHGKVTVIYRNTDLDREACAEALEYVMKHPVPMGGFTTYEEEMEYAKGIHDYIACKVTYDPVGYDSYTLLGLDNYEGKQEAYTSLAEGEDSTICSGYSRGFGLIAHYAGINCAWVKGNEYGDLGSHAWNVIYPCDGSEPVIVDVTWDDTNSVDEVGQTEVSDYYFYLPMSRDYEHDPNWNMQEFIHYLNEEGGVS